nr:hypothetical protein [Providencia rettgeri]
MREPKPTTKPVPSFDIKDGVSYFCPECSERNQRGKSQLQVAKEALEVLHRMSTEELVATLTKAGLIEKDGCDFNHVKKQIFKMVFMNELVDGKFIITEFSNGEISFYTQEKGKETILNKTMPYNESDSTYSTMALDIMKRSLGQIDWIATCTTRSISDGLFNAVSMALVITWRNPSTGSFFSSFLIAFFSPSLTFILSTYEDRADKVSSCNLITLTFSIALNPPSALRKSTPKLVILIKEGSRSSGVLASNSSSARDTGQSAVLSRPLSDK